MRRPRVNGVSFVKEGFEGIEPEEEIEHDSPINVNVFVSSLTAPCDEH